MADYNNLKVVNENGVLTITINRPDKLNALNLETIEELRVVFQEVVYDDDSVKSVILTGAGEKAFVAGADISEIAELNEMNGRKFAESGQEVFSMIEKCHKPVVAAVNGFALGGGCELAMACHFRIATPNAKFGQPEVNLGIIPGYGGTQRLPQLIGKGKALELMMTADFISSEEAKALGLINHIAETQEGLIEMANNLLQKINSKAPLAIGMVIESVNAYYAKEENGFQTEANSFASCCKSEDFKEGTKAFLEKRAAEFKGE
jgi:enoyl-CoA hydratase